MSLNESFNREACHRPARPTGLLRWLLRECVRANPLYVISAGLLAYGISEIMLVIDPRIGKANGVLLGLAILHGYEMLLLVVATTVLKRRAPQGGRDCHGLMIVISIFAAGSFLVMDEPVAIWPAAGSGMVIATALLVWFKMSWYAGLPGIHLPLSQRCVIQGIVTAHAGAPLIEILKLEMEVRPAVVQGLAWMVGWLSLVPIFWILHRHGRANRAGQAIERRQRFSSVDVLQTNICGGCGMAISAVLGVAHLFASEWVFDLHADPMRLIPAGMVLYGLLVSWLHATWAGWTIRWMGLVLLPVIVLQWMWSRRWFLAADWPEAWLGLELQTLVAVSILYIGVALVVRDRRFFWGLVAVCSAPIHTGLNAYRDQVPQFKALMAIGCGILSLLGGMLVSLYRDRILRKLDCAVPGETDDTNAIS